VSFVFAFVDFHASCTDMFEDVVAMQGLVGRCFFTLSSVIFYADVVLLIVANADATDFVCRSGITIG
jgi:hypothetical protein